MATSAPTVSKVARNAAKVILSTVGHNLRNVLRVLLRLILLVGVRFLFRAAAVELHKGSDLKSFVGNLPKNGMLAFHIGVSAVCAG
jgi:hypothetical protein